ncbi:hypothetical protein [Mycoavidus sp. SF9855]|uniref:hypothetical protein n=1 Tax=Mycoavidus sp. SF9855 TaxID=2968475 RepID=UPI00211BBFE9|nr:hypothetical protein [Mycoavidus sp. SF9855]UUM21574.1 hypothetical protein NQD60_00080 [Mycoavidus sp. SF9855]
MASQSASGISALSPEQVREQLTEYQKTIDSYALKRDWENQRKVYEKAIEFLGNVRSQGYFSEQDIDIELAKFYKAYSEFEDHQGNKVKAQELAQKYMSLAMPRKRKLAREDRAFFRRTKENSIPRCFERPRTVPLDPEFERLISSLQINLQGNTIPALNASAIPSTQATQSFVWPTSLDKITDTALLAACLREGIRRSINSVQFSSYQDLAERVLRRFEEEPSCTLSSVQEVVFLIQATGHFGYYRRLIDKLQIPSERILNMAALQGLTVLIQHRARSRHITSDYNLAGDCVRLLEYVHQLLMRAHRKENALQLGALLQTVSLLLDTMFDAGFEQLQPKELKETLERTLRELEDVKDRNSHMDPNIAFQATYALQALKRLNTEKTRWQRAWPIAKDLGKGLAHGVSAVKSGDLDKFLKTFDTLSKGFLKINEEWARYYKKREWYLALHYIDQGIQLNYLHGLETFVKAWSLPGKDRLLQGFCFRLERIVLASSEESTKKWALGLLKQLAQGNTEWGNEKDLAEVKGCAIATLQRIGHFWRLPNKELMERVDYAPAAWHSFWQDRPSSRILNEVQQTARADANAREFLPQIGVSRQEMHTSHVNLAQIVTSFIQSLGVTQAMQSGLMQSQNHVWELVPRGTGRPLSEEQKTSDLTDDQGSIEIEAASTSKQTKYGKKRKRIRQIAIGDNQNAVKGSGNIVEKDSISKEDDVSSAKSKKQPDTPITESIWLEAMRLGERENTDQILIGKNSNSVYGKNNTVATRDTLNALISVVSKTANPSNKS